MYPLKNRERDQFRQYVRSAFGAMLFFVAASFIPSSAVSAEHPSSAAPARVVGPAVPSTSSPIVVDDARAQGTISHPQTPKPPDAVPAHARTPTAESAVPRTGSADPGAARSSAVRAPSELVTPTEEPGLTTPGTLPDVLSPASMFLHADVVVKAVMIGLLLASMATWTVWLAKTIELARAKRKARTALRILFSVQTLPQAARATSGRGDVVARLIAAAESEVQESSELRAEGVKERLAWQLDRIEAAAGRCVARGMSILATVGAVAPFVGLFGTVWGIMNSFVGISRAHTTNLAVVAPGIAEALLATAFGLAAAIPAVVIYNAFTRSTGGYRAILADASVAVLRLVSRDLDRQAASSIGVSSTPKQSISEAAA
jgi:biopolymer transport protein ExbB